MAQYRLSIKVGKGGGSKSHFDYCSREGKFKKKEDDDCVYTDTQNLPTWTKSPRVFWQEHSKAEDGFRKIELSLPNELSREERIELVQTFCEKTFGKDYTYSVAIHEKIGEFSKLENQPQENPHAHIMFSERKIEHDRAEPTKEDYFKKSRTRKDGSISGGYRKDPSIIKTNRKEWLQNKRKLWADLQNERYKEKGLEIRVDHRSYKDQGVDKIPQVHMNLKEVQEVLRGRTVERYDYNETVLIDRKTDREIHQIEQEVSNARATLQANLDRVKKYQKKYLSYKVSKADIKEQIQELTPTDRQGEGLEYPLYNSMNKVAFVIHENGIFETNGKNYSMTDVITKNGDNYYLGNNNLGKNEKLDRAYENDLAYKEDQVKTDETHVKGVLIEEPRTHASVCKFVEEIERKTNTELGQEFIKDLAKEINKMADKVNYFDYKEMEQESLQRFQREGAEFKNFRLCANMYDNGFEHDHLAKSFNQRIERGDYDTHKQTTIMDVERTKDTSKTQIQDLGNSR